ncbi:MAG: bifunctional biotin--[acetyl-CoA-carboxylase] ligase/biotin operon repressor BirA [Streptococcus salivarius]
MKTYEHVYDILSKSPDFVTGESLAKSLGVSRTAIWKAIQTLQEQGIDITSVRKKGYYLEKGDILLPQDISKQLNIPVYFNPDSNSTQLDAKHGMEKNNPTPALYLASSQKAAKGRFDRHFFAIPQGGIYMSIHLKPNCYFADLPPYTMMVALLLSCYPASNWHNTEIKWVNDIYLNNKKMAGILTEAISSIESGRITDVIIGVGLNFSITDFPEELANKATSLFTSEKPSITRNQLISEIWRLFLTIPTSDLVKVYKEKSLVLDKQVTFEQAGKTYTGVAKEIGDKGQLLVLTDDGREKWLTAGEVSLTSW